MDNRKKVVITITAFKNNTPASCNISCELNRLQGLRLTDLQLLVGHLAMTRDVDKRNMATERFLRSVTCYKKDEFQ